MYRRSLLFPSNILYHYLFEWNEVLLNYIPDESLGSSAEYIYICIIRWYNFFQKILCYWYKIPLLAPVSTILPQYWYSLHSYHVQLSWSPPFNLISFKSNEIVTIIIITAIRYLTSWHSMESALRGTHTLFKPLAPYLYLSF